MTSLRLFYRSSKFLRMGFSPARFERRNTWSQPVNESLSNSRQWNSSHNHTSRSRLLVAMSLSFLSIFSFGKDEEEAEPELIMSLKRSVYLIQKGEFQKAEQMLHVALRQAQVLQSFDGITYVYDVMANLAFEVGDIKKAQKLFKSVMQRLLSTGTPENDMKIIHMSLKMAKLYEADGEPEKAEDGYSFCLQHLQEHAKVSPENEDVLILWAMTLDWYAKMLLSQSRLSEALKNYQQAYQLCVKVNGEHHEQTVVILNDLGTVHCLLGQHDQAQSYLSDAITIGERLPEMEDLSSIHVNLGNVYLKKSMFHEAKKSCTKGLKLSKKSNDDETQEQANDCLAEVKKLLGQ